MSRWSRLLTNSARNTVNSSKRPSARLRDVSFHRTVGVRRFPQHGCVSCAQLGLCCVTRARRFQTQPPMGLSGARSMKVLAWEKNADQERDVRFVEPGCSLCEVRACQYWRLDNPRSFDEYLERKFPESRRKAYYLTATQEHLLRILKTDLNLMGWGPRRELGPGGRIGTSIVHYGCKINERIPLVISRYFLQTFTDNCVNPFRRVRNRCGLSLKLTQSDIDSKSRAEDIYSIIINFRLR